MNIKAPLIAQLELTEKCNLRCPHCYRLNPQNYSSHIQLSEIDFKKMRIFPIATADNCFNCDCDSGSE